MWTYILGPFLALLPKDWRNSLPFHDQVDWPRAISFSGLLEFFGAIIFLGYWYVNAMTYMVDHAVGKRWAARFRITRSAAPRFSSGRPTLLRCCLAISCWKAQYAFAGLPLPKPIWDHCHFFLPTKYSPTHSVRRPPLQILHA